MLKKISPVVDYTDFALEILIENQSDERRLEMALRILRADSPMEAAQKILQVDSPIEVAQKILRANSPVEAALHFIHTEEDLNQLIELFRQRNAKQSETN